MIHKLKMLQLKIDINVIYRIQFRIRESENAIVFSARISFTLRNFRCKMMHLKKYVRTTTIKKWRLKCVGI
jgi:hypothetical protein